MARLSHQSLHKITQQAYPNFKIPGAMLGPRSHIGFQGERVLFIALFFFIHGCWSINLEGLTLLKFRSRVQEDPYGVFTNWNSNDSNPCTWTGVHCLEGHVHTLNLRELSLGGTLSPEIGKLSHLRALVLYKNHFSGEIPTEIASLTSLELLDLRSNSLSGTIPAEIGYMASLKHLLLCDNKLEGNTQAEFEKLKTLSELQHDQSLMSDVAVNRKVGHRFKLIKGSLHSLGEECYDTAPGSAEPYFPRRSLLGGSSSNLAALPATGAPIEPVATVPSMGSGSFPSKTSSKGANAKKQPQPNTDETSQSGSAAANDSPPTTTDKSKTDIKGSQGWNYIYVVPAVAFILALTAAIFCMCRNKGAATIGPWKSGLSGQLQKAFVTGVPKLNRAELETACEDFSNIVATLPDLTIFKGTLSSGVEIAVISSSVASTKDWSKRSEQLFWRKIDMFSRVNHKNFANLLGYCEEDEPFLRMMVFEYSPNGILSEHLHVKEVEHLDWPARMRIIMGIAYCLQYMHHELSPPVVHSNLQSNCIYLTDDYAAKLTEVGFWRELALKRKISGDDDSESSELPPADTDSNVYSFGLLMLEIISGKLPYSEEQGSIVKLAMECLNGKRSISYMIDPTLKSFKNNELDIICEVIQDCIHQEPRRRPTMKEVTSKLREVIAISPDAATPRLSPLWWAELEILSVEAS